ncbi:MAG: ABC transporter substrate-binding protein [Paracoccus sp. (in: a-proteobacteria)]|uniref:ABC transporter substrate-binding protein n=1 Tax=Paracoccus sp. TaxID=267 RepID=UPI0039E3CCBE
MRTTLLLSTALIVMGAAAQAQDKSLTILGWGGAYGAAQVEAYLKPFEAKTGIKAVMVDADNPATPIKGQVEAGNVTTDVASVEYADAVRLCDEGLVEQIDPAILTPAPDGTSAQDDFLSGAVTDCFVGTDVYSSVIAYDETKFPDAKPTGPADFFDLEKFPGKRTMRKGAKFGLELALMADGVPPEQVYEVMATPEGVDRAFKKLDTIKKDVIWYEANSQAPQLLADGEVSMAFAFNGRIFDAALKEKKPFKIVWNGQVYELEGWVIPKGAPNLEAAKEFVAFSTSTEPQAHAAEFISYGPPRKSSAAIVGNVVGTDVPMAPNLPTYADNLVGSLAIDTDFWADHDTELKERFSAWLVAN